MPMKRSVPAANPDAYVVGLTGWRRACVEELRAGVRCAGRLEEVVKWGPARPAGVRKLTAAACRLKPRWGIRRA
jgi:hypothetical protein